MTEIQKTIAILRARGPEVILIVGLYTLVDISYSLFGFETPSLANILSIFFVLSLAVISMILNFGFLRTVHLEGPKQQTPSDLLKTGKGFFWRMVGFGFTYIVIYIPLTWILFSIIKYFTSTNAGFFETAKSNPCLYQLCSSATMLILIKVILFIPALILVHDCRVFKSFKFLGKFKLLDSKGLVALYCLSMVMPLLWVLLKIPTNPETISQYIIRTGTNVIHQVLWLIVAVTAVRFVSSLNLVYDSGAKDLS